ncbi:MAG TPA: universal stress protein [Terriglobales bacterium]|nr:universal stress protein [Terriglobales bacterium]
MKLTSILCPIDFSDFSAAAYQYALSLAEYYQARLVGLHVVELWKYPFADYAAHEGDYAKFSRAMSEGGAVQLQRFVKQHSAGGVQPELVVQLGNAPRCILSFAQKENMGAIIMGTHGRSGFDRLVLGSTTDRVMRKAVCPVLVVSNPSQSAVTIGPDGKHHLSRILYCTDFSHNSEGARGYAVSLAAEYGAELTLLHVAENASDSEKAHAILAERARELDKLVSKTERANLKVRLAVRFGKPYEEIVRYAAEAEASLIIMTARGGDTADRAFFGSTTYRVIQLGPCPVLAIHT